MSINIKDGDTKDGDSKHWETLKVVEDSTQRYMSAWESAKANPKIILYSTCACMSSILWGFDIGMSYSVIHGEVDADDGLKALTLLVLPYLGSSWCLVMNTKDNFSFLPPGTHYGPR